MTKASSTDLHPGNILVTTRPPRGMPDRGISQKPIALISDLGESQLTNDNSLGRTAYGDPRYWAPETRNSHQYSKASDVYALGRIVANIVEVNWQVASEKEIATKLIPEAVLRMIIDFQDPRPERRPSASAICQTMDDARLSEGRNNLRLVPFDMMILDSLMPQSGNVPSSSSNSEIPS